MKLELTKSQVENLLVFFEMDFIESIRNHTDIDNMEYLCDMCDIYCKLKEELKTAGKDRTDTVKYVKCGECVEYKPDIIQEGQGFCEVQDEWVAPDECCGSGQKRSDTE